MFLITKLSFKGTENVISSDPLCKDDNSQFTTDIPLKTTFKGTVVNQALHESSLKNTLTVPLAINRLQTILRYLKFYAYLSRGKNFWLR